MSDLLDVEITRSNIDIASPRRPRHARVGAGPVVHASDLPFRLKDQAVVRRRRPLAGRTALAGIDALFGYGRPARVQLAVLADRGHRELPIRPDSVRRTSPTARSST